MAVTGSQCGKIVGFGQLFRVKLFTAENRLLSCNFGGDPRLMRCIVAAQSMVAPNMHSATVATVVVMIVVIVMMIAIVAALSGCGHSSGQWQQLGLW